MAGQGARLGWQATDYPDGWCDHDRLGISAARRARSNGAKRPTGSRCVAMPSAELPPVLAEANRRYRELESLWTHEYLRRRRAASAFGDPSLVHTIGSPGHDRRSMRSSAGSLVVLPMV
jgi:glycerol-3-phosphate dehydrogenase